MNILNRAACLTALLFAALGAPVVAAQTLTEPEMQIMAALMSGENRVSVQGRHADACAVLERAGWTLSRAGVDGQGRAVRVYRDGAGRHSALVWDLKPVQLRVAAGEMVTLGTWTMLE